MTINSLVEALEEQEQAPCDKFACPKRAKCASELLACTAFRYYVTTGRSVKPNIYVPPRVTLRNQVVEMRFIDPTRAIYDSMQSDADDDILGTDDLEHELQGLVEALAEQPLLQTMWSQPEQPNEAPV